MCRGPHGEQRNVMTDNELTDADDGRHSDAVERAIAGADVLTPPRAIR